MPAPPDAAAETSPAHPAAARDDAAADRPPPVAGADPNSDAGGAAPRLAGGAPDDGAGDGRFAPTAQGADTDAGERGVAGSDAAPTAVDVAAAAGPDSDAGTPAVAASDGATPPLDAGDAADAPAADLANTAAPSAAGDAAAAEGTPPADPALFAHALRIAEALVFASDRPVTPARLQGALPPGCDARAVLTALAAACAGRPVQLAEVAGGFAFRTAPELAPAITRVVEVPRRLPRAAMETLAIVAYHQPVTRAEIEEIRGASLSQSTLELLLDAALIAPRGRKEVPGRPSLWGTTPRFLEQFGLKALSDLPRREELVNEPTLPLSAPPAAAPETDAAPPPPAA
jgi:segregation and condensation protein B